MRRWPNRIPNAPLREAYLKSGISASEVCRRLGWMRTGAVKVTADTSTLNRALGLLTSTTVSKGKRYTSLYNTVERERAKLICEAIGVHFDDVYDMPLPETEEPRGGYCKACGEHLVRRAADGLCGFCRDEHAAYDESWQAA